jgi:5-methylcytosine-specific restriction endonuclease McrA
VKTEFKKYGYSKKNGVTYGDIIGCDAIVLKEHLEKQFVDGMNWDNHREWEVDHIFPLSKSENQVNYEKNSHYTNLQPLWKKDNKDKSNKII